MPLTSKGEEIKGAMQKQYGEKKGESVFYASKNKGTITGVDQQPPLVTTPNAGIPAGLTKRGPGIARQTRVK